MKINFRRITGYVAAAIACVMVGTAIPTATQPVAMAEQTTQTVVHTSPFTAAVAQVRDSVVGISNYQMVRYNNYSNGWYGFGFGFGFGNDYYGNQQQPETREVEAATGSGVVIGKGFVLTNYHVVEDAKTLKITVPNEDTNDTDTYDAALVTYDENLDIAIVYAPDLPLDPVLLGDSDTLQVGDWAICIGNPLSKQFSRTVTAGIVSALNRNISSNTTDKYGRRETITNTMIQVDTAINSGNSGGGMFSVTGELMGIPSLKYSGISGSNASIEGIGMCIPINVAKPLIEDVLSGKIQATAPESSTANTTSSAGVQLDDKPRMGITMSGMTQSTNGAYPNGVYVKEVESDSPAEAAGMLAGDIIVDVEDNVITSTAQIQQIVSQYKAGDTLHVKVYRIPENESADKGEYIDLEITLAIISSTVKQ